MAVVSYNNPPAEANTFKTNPSVNTLGISLSDELKEFNRQLTILENILGNELEVNQDLQKSEQITLDI